MYGLTKAVAFCAHLFMQQQVTQESYNRLAFYGSDVPMAVINAEAPAMRARIAQLRYARSCAR